ncbi:MAG: hypothetical protein ACT4O2_01005 [Beijerinckiaceae bacterium]
MQTQSLGISTGWRRPLWIALLVAASVAFTLGFACATPLAAFAAIAALSMPRNDALLLIGLVWLANQAAGFSVLHYPWTADCLAWGVGLGMVALLATLGAEWTAERCNPLGRLASAMAFLAAFAIYEGLLLVTPIIVQSSAEDYTAAIVGRIFAINAIAFILLLAASRLSVSAGLVPEPRRQFAATGRRSQRQSAAPFRAGQG